MEVGPDGHISAAVLNAKAAESRFTLEVESKSYPLDIDNINTYRSKIECESTIDRTWRRGRIFLHIQGLNHSRPSIFDHL